MSDPGKAVFLSYASQDAEAAKRICDALRSAGVEVWFDQNELVGGDAWDQKIRRQIKECALLIPVISQTTQARREAYFRLEWKLADERTHLMAKGTPFLLPVSIDETSDRDALVPDSFLAVQWTRLPLRQAQGFQPDGDALAAFCARVKKLLGGSEVGAASAAIRESSGQHIAAEATPARKLSRFGLLARIAALAALAAAALLLWQPWKKSLLSPAIAPATEAALTEAQKLVEQARQVYENGDELNRDNIFLAEELVQRAIALDPSEPSAWELATWLSYFMIWHSIDDTQARRETLLRQANRAIALAPDSDRAKLAFATAKLIGPNITQIRFAEIEVDLRQLAERDPRNWKIQRSLGVVQWLAGRIADSAATLNRAIELSHGHPMVGADLANVLIRNNRFAEAETVLARALAQQRSGRLLTFNLIVTCQWRGDLDRAVTEIAEWPGWLLQEDRGIAVAWRAALWARKPEVALRLVQQFPRQYVRGLTLSGPRTVLSAQAQETAGNTVAAQADWRATLQQCDADLAANAADVTALYWKAWALARLGDQTAAQASATLLRQRLATVQNNFIGSYTAAALWATVGWTNEAIVALQSEMEKPVGFITLTRALLELEPAFDPIRDDPRFLALAESAPSPKRSDAVAPKANDKSVAVLAFANLSDDKNNEYFSDGISEELLNALARIPGLKVSARTSAFFFKDKQVPIADIAQQLGVAYIVEGSVRKQGDRVRISAQLIKAGDGFNVWSDKFDRDLKDIFAVQDEIAGRIASELSARLGVTPIVALGAGGTKSVEAYEAFLKGRAAWNQRTNASLPEAIRYFRQALAIDPDYALAHGALAEAYVSVSMAGIEPADKVFPLAKASAERALALDPNVVQAYTALAEYAFHYAWEYAESDRLLDRAIAVDPNYSVAYARKAGHFEARNRLEESLALEVKSESVNPLGPDNMQSWTLFLLQRYDEALAAAVRESAPDRFPMSARDNIGTIQFAMGEHEKGIATLEGVVRDFPEETEPLACLGWVYGRAGQREKARAILQRLLAVSESRYVSPLELAFVAAGMDDRDLAFAHLERAFARRDPRLPSIGNDRFFEPIRDDPRFRDMLKRLKLDEFFPETPKE